MVLVSYVIVILLFCLLWWKPTYFLHPRIKYHQHVLKHTVEIVPVGFADWDLHCSCGLVAQC